MYDANGLYAGKEVAQIALAHAYGEGLGGELREHGGGRLQPVLRPADPRLLRPQHVGDQRYQRRGGRGGRYDPRIPGRKRRRLDARGAGSPDGRGRLYLHPLPGYIGVARSAEERLERQKQYLNAFVAQAKEAMRADMTLPLKLYTAGDAVHGDGYHRGRGRVPGRARR